MMMIPSIQIGGSPSPSETHGRLTVILLVKIILIEAINVDKYKLTTQ